MCPPMVLKQRKPDEPAALQLERLRVLHSAPNTDSDSTSNATVTMYSTVWCGYCIRLKSQLTREGISYVDVDIERNSEAADLVMSVNGGNQTVPTVVFPDGSAMSNPSLAQVKERLAA